MPDGTEADDAQVRPGDLTGRVWLRRPGATDEDLRQLQAAYAVPLPAEYLKLLRFSNGGGGPLALPPRLFELDPVQQAIQNASDPVYRNVFQGYLFFGSNGGLESIAFDTRSGEPWAVVMIDCIAGPDSAQVIAANISEFINAIGREYTDQS